jgi:hypothetical protein
LKPVSSAEALSACLTPEILWHTSRTIVSNSRLRHLDQCSMPTASHSPGSIRGQNDQEDPALAVTFASVALRSMQSRAFMRAHKSLPAAARCRRGYHAPAQNLATAQASHQSRELLAYTLHRKSSHTFVGARRVFVGSKSLHAGFSIFYWASSRAWHHPRHTKNGLARSRRLRGLPGLCAAPQLLHARH